MLDFSFKFKRHAVNHLSKKSIFFICNPIFLLVKSNFYHFTSIRSTDKNSDKIFNFTAVMANYIFAVQTNIHSPVVAYFT